jgi:lipopolysaccharide transport system permease protein
MPDPSRKPLDAAAVETGAASSPSLAAVDGGAVTYLPPRPSLGATVRDAWESRHLLRAMGKRVVVQRYARTKLGPSWLVIRPVADTMLKAFVFGAVLKVSGQGGAPYLIVLLVAMVAWRLFERTTTWATKSFDRYGRITRKLDMPLLLAPLAGGAPAFVECAVYFGIVVVAAVVYVFVDGTMYLQLGLESLAALAGFALALAFALSISLWTSVLNAEARDVRQVLGLVMGVWIYITPVVYPLSILPGGLRTVAELNPMTAPVELAKLGLLGTGGPPGVSMASTVVALALVGGAGLFFFSRRASNFMGPAGWSRDEEAEDFGDEL